MFSRTTRQSLALLFFFRLEREKTSQQEAIEAIGARQMQFKNRRRAQERENDTENERTREAPQTVASCERAIFLASVSKQASERPCEGVCMRARASVCEKVCAHALAASWLFAAWQKKNGESCRVARLLSVALVRSPTTNKRRRLALCVRVFAAVGWLFLLRATQTQQNSSHTFNST